MIQTGLFTNRMVIRKQISYAVKKIYTCSSLLTREILQGRLACCILRHTG